MELETMLRKLADDVEWVKTSEIQPQDLQRALMIRARCMVVADLLSKIAKELPRG